MTQYTILGRLKLIMQMDEDTAMAALPFCAAAMEQLALQVKPECKNDPRLDQAAAAMACCMLLQREQSGSMDDISSFKAGDITVTKQGMSAKERLAQAEQTRKAAMEDIRQLRIDTGFYAQDTAYRKPPNQTKRGGKR